MELIDSDSSMRLAASKPHTDSKLQAQFELAKWAAIVAMTLDHYGKIVDPSVYSETNAIGRLAFPLFAWIIGARLSIDASLGQRYLRHLVLWAFVTQPVYVWAGKTWAEPNIFFTLAVGVLLHLAIVERQNQATRIASYGAVLAYLAVGANYGVLGLLMIPVIAGLSVIRVTLGAYAVGPLGVLSNLVAGAPYLGPGASWALLASVIAWLSMRATLLLPRLPKFLFYAYYPAHLVVLRWLASQ